MKRPQSDVVAQHQFLGMRLQVDLIQQLVDLVFADEMGKQREWHDKESEAVPEVIDRIQ